MSSVLISVTNGRSPHQRPHTYEAMASDLEAFLDRHELDRVVLIGHSMGGRLAMHMAPIPSGADPWAVCFGCFTVRWA